jgi:hypothetical protein
MRGLRTIFIKTISESWTKSIDKWQEVEVTIDKEEEGNTLHTITEDSLKNSVPVQMMWCPSCTSSDDMMPFLY